jgi:isoamylase
VIDGLPKSSSSPLGAWPSTEGVNFSVFSKHATGVQLLLFDGVDDSRPARIVRLDPSADRTYHYWHAFQRSTAATTRAARATTRRQR